MTARFIASLKLRQLQYFLAVAEHLHFTRAAESLGVTQPTLSHQLAELESHVGTPLFDRLGKTVQLTGAGVLFQRFASGALKELSAGRTALDELEGLQRGSLRIGVIQSFSRTLLPPILGRFLQQHPSVTLRVDEMPADAIEQQLTTGLLDIGIAFAPATLEDTVLEPLLDEKMLLAVAPGHPLARRARLRLCELRGVKLALLNTEFSTRRLIDRIFASAGVTLDVVCETNSIEVLLGTVTDGPLGTVIPEQAIGQARSRSLRRIHLVDPTPVRTSALLWPRHAFRTIAARTFGQMVRERFLHGADLS